MSRRWALGIITCAWLGCDGPTAGPIAVAPAPVSDVVVEPVWAGCHDWVGTKCLLVADAGASLRFWVDVPPGVTVGVSFDGVPIEGTTESADGGTRVTVAVPAGAAVAEVQGPGVAGRLEIAWHMRRPELGAAIAAFEAGKFVDGCASLSGREQWDPVDRLAAVRMAPACGAAVPDAEAVAQAGAAADLAYAHGLPKAFAGYATAALYMCLVRMGDVECASKWEQRLASELPREVEVWTSYSRGLVDVQRGDLVRALERFASSEQWADRLGMASDYENAFEQRINVLAELGRADAARDAAAQRYLRSRSVAEPCVRARAINNAAWPVQVLVEAGLHDEPPLDWMLEEAEIYERGECKLPRDKVLSRINVASALLADGDLEGAKDWLSRIVDDGFSESATELAPEIEYLARGIALASNEWDLAPIALLGRVDPSADPRLRWRSRVQDAAMLERFGLDAAALQAWRDAERVLDVELAQVGLGQGRESFVSARGSSATGLVEALLRAGATDEALCRLRIARGRAMRAADRRLHRAGDTDVSRFDAFVALRGELDDEAGKDWAFSGEELTRRRARREERRRAGLDLLALPSAEGAEFGCALLPARAPAELLLAMQPSADGVLVVTDGPHGQRVHRAPSLPASEAARLAWAEAVLHANAAHLEGVTAVRVLPIGATWTVPIHAARVGGVPLVDRVTVTYGLDLLGRRDDAIAERRALILADPSDDLPSAGEEREVVRASLERAGWEVDALDGAAAGREAVLARLQGLELFHYAGHGQQRGEDGWDAALLLGEGKTIEAADVLAAAGVPRVVILAGCETGAVRAALLDGGMSLGRAFLLAGAEAVLVGDRTVDDAASLAFSRALYEDARGFDVAQAVRGAYRSRLQAAAPVHTWSGFRLIVR